MSTDGLIVVENMFGATDHDHLGKLITYAAGLGAHYAVLLAPEFREEHRSVLNWLNSVSADDFGFFGVVLEAWRIGDSLPAPRLRVDVKPDSWGRSVRAARVHSEGNERADIPAILGRIPARFPRPVSRLGPGYDALDAPPYDVPVFAIQPAELQRGVLPIRRELPTASPCVYRHWRPGDAETTKAAFDDLS